ncbi:MAG TPA: class I SAM-dependent methyltransferase [Polyangiaceae bacterium]|jgi:predicted TPR repeat methyltransferase
MPADERLQEGLVYAEDERLAAFYERHIVGDCHYRAPAVVSEWIEQSGRGGRWLDLGAGTGLVGKALAERSNASRLQLVAVDSSAAMLSLIEDGLYTDRVQADCRGRLPFDDAAFDGAVACGLLEHIETTEALWRELGRLLAPTAPLIFTFPPAAGDEQEATLASHDPVVLQRHVEAAGFSWDIAIEIPAYQPGHREWVRYRLVRATRI